MQEVGIFVLHWMWEVGKGDWTFVTPAIQCSVGCLLLLLWHSGPDIIPNWMEQIGSNSWQLRPECHSMDIVRGGCAPGHKDL